MGSLVFEVLSGASQVLVGRAQIINIATLSPNKPLTGIFPVLSADAEKVAELKVSVALESLMSSYDSASSAPTTDVSLDFCSVESPPINMPRVIPAPSVVSDSQFVGKVPSGRVTPMGVDARLYSSVPPSSPVDMIREPSRPANPLNMVTQAPGNVLPDAGQETVVKDPAVQLGDLLSNLLAKGSKLRDAMIISSLDARPSANTKLTSADSRAHRMLPSTEPFHDMSKMGNGRFGLISDTDDDDDDDNMVPLMSDIDDSSLSRQLHLKSDTDDSCELSWLAPLSSSHSRSRNSSVSLNKPGNQRPASRRSSVSSQNVAPAASSSAAVRRPSSSSDGTPKVSRMGRNQKLKKKKRKNTKLQSGSDSETPAVRRPSNCSNGVPKISRPGTNQKLKKTRRKTKLQSGSDSETSASCQSEGSRVSFDPVPSDSETNTSGQRNKTNQIDGLSVHRLTLLGRVHMARVVVDTLSLADTGLDLAPARDRQSFNVRGKPPTPTRTRLGKRTYFVEYQFPVVATSRDKLRPNAMATEVMRVVSKMVTNNLVTFGHRSAFPVMFDAESLEKWWKSALVFKVYCKSSLQKLPKLVGMCSLTLKSVLQSDALFLDKTLDVKDRSTVGSSSTSVTGREADWLLVGQLKVHVELASDSKDFATALAKTQLAELTCSKIIPIPQPKPKTRIIVEAKPQTSKAGTTGTQTEPVPTDINSMPLDVPHMHTETSRQVVYDVTTRPAVDFDAAEALTLHTLLMVFDGKNITHQGTQPVRHPSSSTTPSVVPKPHSGWNGHDSRDSVTRNLYIVCRMFWCDDVCRSDICWGTCDPQFHFSQVTPVLLTHSLLERMRNNFMVIEVWDKKTSSQEDQLVGIVKVSLHQFFMSYRDRKIAAALLRSQYPVIAMENELPIVNLATGHHYGSLKVLLAMGSMEQVSLYQRQQDGTASAFAVTERPRNYLERSHMNGGENSPFLHSHVAENMVEHVFEVVIENITGLKLLDNTVWGEADSFIQYHFPAQTASTSRMGGTTVVCGTPSLKTYRTGTTLCVPDLVFNDISRHKIVLPEGTPVQREILTACAGVGGGAGGVPFEVWCRYYYPNVRDQVIAKAVLPLAKLCAMVTMKKPGETSINTFSLPLATLLSQTGETDQDQETVSKLPITGNLSVTVNYRTNLIKSDSVTDPSNVMAKSLPAAVVCISVGVIKASGLQTAACVLARSDESMQYASEVGVNSYVRVRLSFLQKEDERLTRTMARTFGPEFSSHMDFPCPLLWTEPGSDALSLAEILENAEAKFEVWHQVPGNSFESDKQRQHQAAGTSEISGRRLLALSGDILLGTVTVPLVQLLRRTSGVSGWYPIMVPNVGWDSNHKAVDDDPTQEMSQRTQRLERVVGGLELSVKFAHSEDHDRVCNAARGVGWSPVYDIETRDWDDADKSAENRYELSVVVDSVGFPLQNALFAGQSNLDSAATCYIRYKFYDRKAVCSKASVMSETDSHYLSSEIKHQKTFVASGTAPFFWYLNEERLEIQVWVTYQRESSDTRPRTRDKLIGSAFVDLASLADRHRKQHRISSIYPLFKPGASSLGGACLTGSITLRPCSSLIDSSDDESDVDTGVLHGKQSPSKRAHTTEKDVRPIAVESVIDLEKTFAVHISIERAFHLPMVLDNKRGVKPNTYVSYQTADNPDVTCTEIFADSNDPIWCHENDCRLSNDLLTVDNMKFVLRVWHKPSSGTQVPDKAADKALGFVSVDLMPLTKGFPHIAGFYNLIDFNGLCQGQIKVSIVPVGMFSARSTGSVSEPLSASSVFMPTLSHWMPTGIDSSLPRFSEHFESIRRHHSELQHQVQQQVPDDSASASRSVLFQTLRKNLQELDSITANLRQRIFGVEHTDLGQDGESAVPLSTSSALMTYSTAVPGGTDTWGLPSTMHTDVQLTADGLASTGGSANTNDAVVEMMRCTLNGTGSTVRGDHGDHTDYAGSRTGSEHNSSDHRSTRASGDQRLLGYGAERFPDTEEAGSDIETYRDSLKHAKALLEQVRHLTANGGSVAENEDFARHSNSFTFEETQDGEQFGRSEADGLQEEDTFANIWAMRQSSRHGPGSDGGESLDSTVEPADRETSYVAPRMLNDVDDIFGIEPNLKLPENDFANSGDTWFVDTQDERDVSNVLTAEIQRRLNVDPECNSDPDSVDMSTSTSPARLRMTDSNEVSLYRRSRMSRTSAMMRRENAGEGDASGSDVDIDVIGNSRSRQRRLHHTRRPRESPVTTPPINEGCPPSAVSPTNGDLLPINGHQPPAQDRVGGTTVLSDDVWSASDEDGKTRPTTGRAVNDDVDEPSGMVSSDDADHLPVADGDLVASDASATAAADQLPLVSNIRPTSAQTSADGGSSTGAPSSKNARVPNFFLEPSALEMSMRRVYNAGSSGSRPPSSKRDANDVDANKTIAARELVTKLTSFKHPPSARTVAAPQSCEQAQRIARIFSHKFS